MSDTSTKRSTGLDAAGEWRREGILFLVSAPSGTGKTTLCERIRREFQPAYSVSCTTRAPREGEVDGVHYHFVSLTDFAEKVHKGEFLEHAEVHGNYYGTLRQPVLDYLEAGVDVLMEIDTEGAAQIRHNSDGRVRRCLVDTFIMPPSIQELRRRLRERNSETSEQIERRMLNAVTEMRSWREYQYTIVSASKEEDFDRFRSIYLSQRALTRRLIPPEGTK
jgi:guanylate kinase